MTAYLIYEADVTDEEQYRKYMPLAAASSAPFGGRYLARGGTTVVLEGESPANRRVVIEFPDVESAVGFYNSDAYREARAVRAGAANAYVYVVEGAS